MLRISLSLLGFAVLNIIALFFIKVKKHKDILLFVLCAYLLLFKICEYMYFFISGYKTFIVEISTISYFLFTIAYLFKIKIIEQLSIFCALISGFFFIVSFVFYRSNFIYRNEFDKYTTIINHTILYFGAILQLKFNKYDAAKYYTVIFGFLAMILYAVIVKQIFVFDAPVTIFLLMDGSYFLAVMPALSDSKLFLPLYYLAFAIIFIIVLWFFYKLNRLLNYKYSKQAETVEQCIENIELEENKII